MSLLPRPIDQNDDRTITVTITNTNTMTAQRATARANSTTSAVDRDRVVAAVAPEAGHCLLFRQPPGYRLPHDGEEVKGGIKYLLRSDVMYRRVGASIVRGE